MTTPAHILIVDDDVDFAESLAEVLLARRYLVTLAHSGAEGLAQLAAGPVDLVLLDMRMPGMDGMECLTAMRRLRPGIDVVMVTAFTKAELIRQALQAGALAVLHKPVSVDELLAAIAFVPKPASLLLVEDDADLAQELSGVLARAGYRVEGAAGVAAAQAALARQPMNLVLLDYRLPGGTGKDLLDWLKAGGRQEAVVVLTAYPDAALDQLPCLSTRDILVKPFTPDSLLETVSRRIGAARLRHPPPF